MMGLLTKPDSTLYRGFFKEMAKLRGISVKYQYPLKVDMTIHAESKTQLSEAIDMDIIFDTNPKVSTLKKMGWLSEGANDKPYIAQLPFDSPNLMVECVISIPPFEEINSRARKFKVTSINTLLEFPDCWTCSLAPIFDSDIPKNSYEESNYNYVDTEDTPQADTPDNSVPIKDKLKSSSEGSYFNI